MVAQDKEMLLGQLANERRSNAKDLEELSEQMQDFFMELNED